MSGRIQALAIATMLWNLPAAAQAGGVIPTPPSRGAECKRAQPQERTQPTNAKAPAARETGRGILGLGWLSSIGRQSSPLLP